jgi:hypothetical protein
VVWKCVVENCFIKNSLTWKFYRSNLNYLFKSILIDCSDWLIRCCIEYEMDAVEIMVDYIIKSRSESFCEKPRDWKPRRSRARQLGEAQKDLLWMILCTILSSSGLQKKIGHKVHLKIKKPPTSHFPPELLSATLSSVKFGEIW